MGVLRWCDNAKYSVCITRSFEQKMEENKEGSPCWRMQLLARSEQQTR
jgi:hypothetical protein